jgi:hypothetical protein
MTGQNTVEVPGSGRLTDEERQLLAQVHTMVPLTPDTPMFQVLPPGAIRVYLSNTVAMREPTGAVTLDYRTAGGYVARVIDAEELRTPAQFIEAFHFDYPTTGFHLNVARLHVIEFLAGPVDRYTVPFGAPAHPDPALGLAPDSSAVSAAADAMVASALAAGVDPSRFTRQIDYWPYTGTGLTPNPATGLPVWWRRYDDLPEGAMIHEHDSAGEKRPVARYRGRMQGWQDLR